MILVKRPGADGRFVQSKVHVKLEDFSQVMRDSPSVTSGSGAATASSSLLKLSKVEDGVAKENEDGAPLVRLPETPKKFEGR